MNIKGIFDEFKAFAFKGNIIDLAVALVMAAAFTELVKGVVDGLVIPLISFSGAAIKLGLFRLISGIGQFLALAAGVFFIFVKPINKLRAMSEKPKDPNAPPPALPATLDDVVAAIKELQKVATSGNTPTSH